MKRNLFYSFIAFIFLLGIFSCGTSNEYSQSFIILINGLKVGKLLINEKPDFNGNLVLLSEQERDTYTSKGKTRKIIKTKMIIPEEKLFPISYSYDSSNGTSYNVKLENGKIIRTIQIEGELQEYKKPFKQGMLMLDLMGYHTVDYWIRRYDRDKGGQQVFLTYLLPTGTIKPLTVTPVRTFIHENESKDLKLRNYEIEIDERLTILIWVDSNNHLYRMYFKGPNVEVLHSDLYDQLNKIKQSKDKNP